MDTGGYVFRIRVDHEISDYDIKFRKLLSSDIDGIIKKKFDENAIIDDNFDGTYDGYLSLFFTGKYRVKITLNELEIKNSPFEIECRPGKVSPSNCISYFGKFADFSALLTGTINLICNCEDGMVFTVSCYDKYGNKCTEISGVSISVNCELQSENNEKVETISSETYSQGSNGIFPCVLHSPNEIGIYKVSVYLSDYSNTKKHIKGSPYNLTVNPKVVDNQNESTTFNSIDKIDIVNEDILTEEENKIITLTKMEITRQRALDALRKKMNLIKFEKEMKKRKANIKRVGGGFLISYSKDI